MEVVGYLVITFLILFWAFQLTQLMMLSDQDFPGRFDKILWVILFLLVSPLAPFLFLYWKSGYVALRVQEREEAQS